MYHLFFFLSFLLPDTSTYIIIHRLMAGTSREMKLLQRATLRRVSQ